MKKALCGFVAFALLLAQFPGCASMPTPTRPAVISDSEPSAVAPVPIDSMDETAFHAKIAELKGKIRQRHGGDSSYAPIAAAVDRLDQAQDSTDAGNIGNKRGLAQFGVVMPAVVIAIPLIGINLQASGGSGDWTGMGTMFLLAILPVAVGIGALTGWFGGALIAGPNVTPAQKMALSGLIMDYNKLDGMTGAPQSADTTK